MSSRNINEEIDAATKQGHEELTEGKIDNACSSFEKAVQLAEELNECFTERACYFNLGACYVARGDARKGVEFLLKAFPPDKESDGNANYADLHYNLGTAYDALKEIENAVKCYEIAAEEYKAQENKEMQAESLLRLGNDCTSLGKFEKGAEIYKLAAEVFNVLGDKKSELLILNNRASLLAELRNIQTCGEVLTQVLELCEEVDDSALKGKVYNDLGLLYNGLKSYQYAAECFERAIPLVQANSTDKQLAAVLQQNLGAIYNQLGKFKKAMECHKQATTLHGALSNRTAQGQVFCNMGFAQSQLGDYRSAGESFMHAIQAAKDSGDKQGLWQAYEGMAAVCFLGQDYNKAVEYYKLALSVLSTAGEREPEHNDRIVSKLANALERQLVAAKKVKGRLPPLRGNSVKRDEGNVSVEEKDGTKRRVGKTRVRQEHHKLIARGIDGQQSPPESEQSGSEKELSSDEDASVTNEREHARHVKNTTEVEIHHEERSRGPRVKTVTTSSEEEHVAWEKPRTKSRHSRKERKVSPKEMSQTRWSENYYEEPIEENRISSPVKSDHSDEMPRAHREAYLASVQAATPRSQPPIHDENNVVQSRTCLIQ